MTISVLIATYGEDEWRDLAWSRAYPSAKAQIEDVACFHDPEGTIASVRNEMANTARGEWLLFLDADDEIAPGYISAMTRAAERVGDGPALLTPAVQQLRKNGSVRGAPTFFDRGISLRDDNWLVIGTLVQRDFFLSVGGFDEYPHGFEDFSAWSKCFRAGATVVKVPDAVYRYWVNPRSKHKQGWRDRKWQVATHQRVVAELAEWERARP
jgi:glycosyltransferase involved in cell wall biosynthesis